MREERLWGKVPGGLYSGVGWGRGGHRASFLGGFEQGHWSLPVRESLRLPPSTGIQVEVGTCNLTAVTAESLEAQEGAGWVRVTLAVTASLRLAASVFGRAWEPMCMETFPKASVCAISWIHVHAQKLRGLH